MWRKQLLGFLTFLVLALGQEVPLGPEDPQCPAVTPVRGPTTPAGARDYLLRYGYVSVHDLWTGDGTDPFVRAIRKFQSLASINQTGIIDNATYEAMQLERCGNPDVSLSARHRRFVYNGNKWGKQHLTYRIMDYTEDLPQHDVDRIIAEAFQIWANVTPLTFTASTCHPVDIEIGFAVGNHGDSHPFDGPGGEFGHALQPLNERTVYTHFDDAEDWVDQETLGGQRLLITAVHEFGHNLGLGHSGVETSIMRAMKYDGRKDAILDEDDIKGIQYIYKTPKDFDPSEPLPEYDCDAVGTTTLAVTPTSRPAATSPTSTPAAESPTTTPAAESPTTTPAAELPTTTPADTSPATTPAAELPTTTPAAELPTTTPADTSPATTPAAELPTTTPAATSRTTTPAAELPTTTPAATSPTTTPVATSQTTTLLPTSTPVPTSPKTMPVVISSQTTSVATSPKTTPAATSPKTTSVATSPKTTSVATSPKTTSVATSPKTTSVATSPKTTSVATSPKTTSVATSPKTTPAATSPKTTSVATSPKTTSVATSPKTTSVATSPKTTSVATSPKTTPAATSPKTTSVATSPKTTSVATSPKTTSVATSPKTTPVATSRKTTPAPTSPKTTPAATLLTAMSTLIPTLSTSMPVAISPVTWPVATSQSAAANDPTKSIRTTKMPRCNGTFEAITRAADNEIYAFRDGLVMRLTHSGRIDYGFPKRIREVFPGAPSSVDAAVSVPFSTWKGDGFTYLVQGSWVWRYGVVHKRIFHLDKSWLRLRDAFDINARKIDAAYNTGDKHLNRVKITAGERLWRVTIDQRGRPTASRYNTWDDHMLTRLPERPDAAFYDWGVAKKTYFFSGPNYYRLTSRRHGRLIGPRNTGIWWLGCVTD